jgi:hypothetical protein
MKTRYYDRQIRRTHPLPHRQRFSAACRNKLNALKELVTRQLAAEYSNSVPATLLRQAVQEADALAATTPFPDLFLPVLAEEKVRSASLWSERQKQIHRETMAFAT